MELASPARLAASPQKARTPGAVLPAALVAAFIASLPVLSVGFSSDDLTHRLILEGKVPGYAASWLGLYDFTPPELPASALIEHGLFPWFTDPQFSLRFLRPLSSFTLGLDHGLFDRNAVAAHAHSVLWMLVLAAAAAALFQRWLEPRGARFAAIVFGVSGVFSIPVGWLAARHTLVAAAFGALALLAWQRYRESAARRELALALAALVLSLLSSESGLVTVPLIVGIEITACGLRRGFSRAALPIGVGVVYVVTYAALGYGARGSTFYVSPFQNPLDYLVVALLGVPALVAELLLGVPSIFAGLGGTPALLTLGVLGLGAAAGAHFLYRSLGDDVTAEARSTLKGLALGAAVGMVALVGAPVSGRVLPLPAIAAAALVGQALASCWCRARGASGTQTGGRKRWYAAAGAIALFHLLLSPGMRLFVPIQMKASGETQEKIAREADVGNCGRAGSIYLVNGSDPTLTLYAAAALLFYTPEKAQAEHFRVLSMAPQRQRLSRVAADAVELEVVGARSTSNPFEELFRGKGRALPLQTELRTGELGVRVEAANDHLFTRARFVIAGGIDPSQHCLLAWRNQRLETLPWPALGENIEIAHEPGPLGL
jgi:hypothetical protein